MPDRQVVIAEEIPAPLREGLARLRQSLNVPDEFPADVLAAASAAVERQTLPEADATQIDFVTIDPPGSLDLDQAVHIRTEGAGYVVNYAIADVGAFVQPGDPVDLEAHRRGQTFYAPTRRTPLHPEVLSEGATSLLPEQVRPALLWELHLDATGECAGASVRRARVRSRRRLSYDQAQAALDAGTADDLLLLLRTVGQLREQLEVDRGGVSLGVPEQEVHAQGEHWELSYRTPLPVEGWNAQISLLTGMAAAKLMLGAGVGVLRTLPPADPGAIRRLRQTARALHIPWPDQQDYPDFVRSLDPSVHTHAAMLNACTTLFRGAGYVAFDGGAPEQALHAALAASYAHCTAPLRRLVDRYVGEVCLAICAGTPVPDWVRAALPGLAPDMEESNRRVKKYERGIVDLVEALVLSPHLGEAFAGTVIEADTERGDGTLQLNEPAVQARVTGAGLKLGADLTATLTAADVTTGNVRFKA